MHRWPSGQHGITPAQVEAATFDEALQSWLVLAMHSDTKTTGEHRLVFLGDVVSSSDDEMKLMEMRKFWRC